MIHIKKYRITKTGKIIIYLVSFVLVLIVVNINVDIRSEISKSVKASKDSSTKKIVSSNTNIVKDITKVDVVNTSVDKTIQPKNDKDEISIPVENAYTNDGKKIAFLTFDDGPSTVNTGKVLDILKSNNIKATFFVVGSFAQSNPDILKRTVNEGHMIGNHSFTHNYNNIYASVDAFMSEIKKTEGVLKEVLGDKFSSRLVRFPGGSFENSKQAFRQELVKDGYVYVDWNVINGDGEGLDIQPSVLLNRVISTAGNQKHIVVLMHDSATKQTTVEALQSVIDNLKSQGYEFAMLK